MKCLAANPDLGAEEDKRYIFLLSIFKREISNSAKMVKLKLQHCRESLTYSPIATMWNCYLDVCLHNGLIQRTNSVIISTVSNTIKIHAPNINSYIWLLKNVLGRFTIQF